MTFINIIYNYPYAISFILLVVGIFIIVNSKNLIMKIVGLNIFQSAVILFFIIIAKIDNAIPPVVTEHTTKQLSNPTPHVLMLTAIVVSIATTALAYSIILIIYRQYHTINEDVITKHMNNEEN